MRTDAKRDANEMGIIKGLRSHGCKVQQVFQGKGVPDLLVWTPFLMRFVLLEVKMPKQKLRPEQVAWFAEWDGAHVYKIESLEEAMVTCGIPTPTPSP